MAEILTESFCERCGSRYTFESEVPRARLRGVKVLSKGLKNFVLDDKTSIDEAMAAARDDTDRALTSHQLEAFHQTFNFCMQCRQYICPDCWNDGEGQCLTCAPLLGRAILAAPLSRVDPAAGIEPSDGNGLAAAAMNGHGTGSDGEPGIDALARLDPLTIDPAPTDPAPEMIGTSEVEARAEAAEAADAKAADAEPEHWLMVVEPAAEDLIGTETASSVAETEAPPAEAETVSVAETETEAVAPTETETLPAEAGAVAVPDEAPTPVDLAVEAADDIAAASDVADAPDPVTTASQTDILLAGLQPGQSLDEAIAAFESQPTVAAQLEQVELPSAAHTIDSEVPTEGGAEDVIAEQAAEPAPAAVEPPEVVSSAPEEVAPVAEWVEAGWDAEAALADVPLAADVEPAAPVPAVEPLDEIPTGEPVAAEVVAADADEWQTEPLDELVSPEPLDAAPVALEPALTQAVAAEPVDVQPDIEPVPVETPAPAVHEPFEIAAAATADVIEQPAWSIVAPSDLPAEVPTPFADQAIEPVAPMPPPAFPTGATPEPSWPTHPTLPSVAPSTGLPFLGRHTTPTGGVEALWAASDLAVSAPRAGSGKPAGGVQPCVSCGLSLSATARFCRRCGSAQVA